MDLTKLGNAMGAIQAKAEQEAIDETAKVALRIGNMLETNPDDPRVEAAKKILGFKGDISDEAKALLGQTTPPVGAALAQQQTALASPFSVYPLYNEDQTPTGTTVTDAQAAAAGYVRVFDHNDATKTVAFIKSIPKNTVNNDEEVPVYDKKERKVVAKVKVSDGANDPGLETVYDTDTKKVTHFIEKGLFSSKRRS